MDKTRTLAEQIDILLAEAQDDYKFGGDEDAEGNLGWGFVDFDGLRAKVRAILEAVKVLNG